MIARLELEVRSRDRVLASHTGVVPRLGPLVSDTLYHHLYEASTSFVREAVDDCVGKNNDSYDLRTVAQTVAAVYDCRPESVAWISQYWCALSQSGTRNSRFSPGMRRPAQNAA
jgi:hypothetical protein